MTTLTLDLRKIATAILILSAQLSFSQPAPQTDFHAEGMMVQMLPPIPGSIDSFFDIFPEVVVSTNNEADMPLHADLYVNDILVAQDQMHMVRAAGGGNGCPASCIGNCQIDVWHPGGPVVMYGGTCVTLTSPDSCVCQTGPIELWPLQNIELEPGDILRLVLDPQNLVPEYDETNNELVLEYRVDTDLEAHDGEFWFETLIPGHSIGPIVNIGSNSQLTLPLHADLYVNGVLMGEDRMHRVKTAGGQCMADTCGQTCQVDIWHPGGTVVMHQGVCNPLTPSGCYCYVREKKLWPFEGIPLNDGDKVRIVIDPLNQVQELDETNNEIILRYGAHTDFIPVEMEFLQLGPGLYDIEPIVDFGTNNQLAMPLEADLYVNGVLLGQDRMHMVKEAGGQCPDDNCIGTCQVDIWHPGGVVVMHQGICVQLTPEGCYCYVANKRLWPFTGIPLSPGDEITLVLDPEGRIPEIDETNNTLITTWFPEFDFQPVDMQFLCRNALGYVTVPSIFIIDSDGLEKPLHVDLKINGETVVSQDECSGIVDIVKCPSGGECTGSCSWKVIRKEKSNLTYTGN
ncbi:MAG: hypothetical protein HKN79_10455, partial [Flavobacteriales bacterium]|nr:hypothetical protein [Flavobacteriales bacterium]